MKKRFILCSLVLGMSAATVSCGGDEYFYDYSSDTTVVNNNISIYDTTVVYNVEKGDTLVINITNAGDTIVVNGGDTYITNAGDTIVVNGGDTYIENNTNVNAGDAGGNGGGNTSEKIDERIRRVLKKSSVWAIPAEDFPKRVRCRMVEKETGNNKATFRRFRPSSSEKAVAYYDASQDITTLAYPFKNNEVWTMGKFGSDIDKYRTIYALRIENGVASIGHWGYGEELTIVQQFLFILEEDFLLCGLPACDGNNPNNQEAFDDESQRTGRTLLGVNAEGTTVYLFIAEDATVSEAYDAFAFLGYCTPSRMMAVSGGSSTLGLKPVPVTAEVDSDEEIDLEKFVLPE